MNRNNRDDHVIDSQGKLILALCKTSSLRILNGRTAGDTTGKFTRYPSNLCDKPSVIDYALCSVPLLEDVITFSVLPFSGLSDHCCIALKIRANVKICNQPSIGDQKEEVNKITDNYKYTYDKKRKHIYEQTLQNDTNIEKLSKFLDKTALNSENIDIPITQLNDILLNAARKSFFVQRVKIKRKHKKSQTQDWFNRECNARRKQLRQKSKDLSSNPCTH